jgi:hypothetical protein
MFPIPKVTFSVMFFAKKPEGHVTFSTLLWRGQGTCSGGLIGSNNGDVDDCSAICSIEGLDTIGGLIGYNDLGNIRSSWSSAEIMGRNNIGGLIGKNDYFSIFESLIERCSSHSTIKGHDNVGGLVGWNGRIINNSFADGSIVGDSEVGGLVGNNPGEINNCYSWTKVNGIYHPGGLVGYNIGIIDKSYAKGYVKSVGIGGGFIGFNDSNEISGFWDIETSRFSTSNGGIGKTTKEMMTRSTFTEAGWDFDDIWCIGDGNSYPMFRWQDRLPPIADPGTNLITYEDTVFTFDGSDCWDDIGISNYTWTCRDPNFHLYGIAPTYVFKDWGIYDFHLRVTDPVGKSDQIPFKVTVIDRTDPKADAGYDVIGYEDRPIIFQADGCSDNDRIANYTWSIDEGNRTTTLFGECVSHIFSEPGFYSAVLKVTDPVGLWDTDSVLITILDDTNPIARAGDDSFVNEDTLVFFDASESTDNVMIVNWTWTIYEKGGHTTLFGPIQQYNFTEPGDYLVDLIVSDEIGLTGEDELVVHVIDVTRPVAIAGMNLTVNEDTIVTLNGSSSYDNGPITNYTWSIYDNTDPILLYGPVVKYLFLTPGKYEIWLGVIDASGMSDLDHIFVEVIDTTPPVAEAGPDITIDQEERVYFNGSLSSDNVRVVVYIWTFNDGPMEMKLYGISPVYNFRHPGTYTVRLNVSDGRRMSDDDFNTVTVTDTEAPVAYAGKDIEIKQGDRAILNADGSSDNVGIVNYSWAFTVGRDTIVLYGDVTEYRFDKAGSFQVVLTVTDAAGNSASDTVTINVSDDVSYIWLLIIAAIVIITGAIAACILILRKKKEHIEE